MYLFFINMLEIGFGISFCVDSQGKIVGKIDKIVVVIIDYGMFFFIIYIVSDVFNELMLLVFCGNIIGIVNVMLSLKVYNGNNNDFLIGIV